MLLQLPQLFGSIDVLHKAAGLTKNQDCLAAIDRLLKLYDYLKIIGYDKYISFDLGALSNHGYYTGIIFAGYTFGVGEPVVNGGRYDLSLIHIWHRTIRRAFIRCFLPRQGQ